MSWVGVTIFVIYASQTGNAEELAFLFFENLKRNGFDAQFRDITDFQPELLHTRHVCVFFVSTTGNGDPPDSMVPFWKYLLQRNIPLNWLERNSFAVFGLGDSSYQHYNVVARKLFARLIQLGSRPMFHLGLGDDQGKFGFWGNFHRWMVEFFSSQFSSNSINPLNSVSTLSCDTNSPTYALDPILVLKNEFSTNNPCFCANVVKTQRITNDSWYQDVRRVVVGIEEPGFSFEAGDVLTIHYFNNNSSVQRAVQLLSDLDLDQTIEISSMDDAPVRKSRLSFPCAILLRDLLTMILDINGIPKPSFFRAVANFASTDEKKRKLVEISEVQGFDLYFSYCLRERRSYIDILEEFEILNMPLEQWVMLVPLITPRSYSIASSPACGINKVDLCIAIAHYITPLGRQRNGLCSDYVANLLVGDKILVGRRNGKISEGPLTKSKFSLPLLCIATGTGIAPIRSVLQEKIARCENGLSQTMLLQGCRRSQEDDLFVDEWSKLQQNISPYEFECEISCKKFCAFVFSIAYSQQGQIKRHVTHLIKENEAAIVKLLGKNGCIVISGSSSRMPKDVQAALCNAFVTCAQMTPSEASAHICSLIKSKRIIVDAW